MSQKKDWSPQHNRGPLVRNGPTGGQNRARNKDGQWRAKRSDAGKSRNGGQSGGCFVTTAACEHQGLPDDCRELTILRRFRDEHLSSTSTGRALIAQYYADAPALAARLARREDVEFVWSEVLSCVSAIDRGQHSLAVEIYRGAMEELQRRLAKDP